MSNRNINLLGEAFAASGSVSLTVGVNGTAIHNGAVTTTAGAAPTMGSYTDAKDGALVGTVREYAAETLSFSVAVSGGQCIITGLSTSNPPVVLATTANDNQVLTNVQINGESPELESSDGQRHYLLEDGDVMTFTADFA